MSWLGFGQANSQAPAEKDMDNYDMDLKVYVRSGTPLFKLSSINSPGVDKPDGVEAGTAPGTFTDSIMKTFYGNDYNTVAAAPVTTPPAQAPVTNTAAASQAPASQAPPASQGTTQSNNDGNMQIIENHIKRITLLAEGANGKDEYIKKLNFIRDYYKQNPNIFETFDNKLNNIKTKGDISTILSQLTINNGYKKGGRRTRHVRKGKHARKSHRNRKHTKRYFEFF